MKKKPRRRKSPAPRKGRVMPRPRAASPRKGQTGYGTVYGKINRLRPGKAVLLPIPKGANRRAALNRLTAAIKLGLERDHIKGQVRGLLKKGYELNRTYLPRRKKIEVALQKAA